MLSKVALMTGGAAACDDNAGQPSAGPKDRTMVIKCNCQREYIDGRCSAWNAAAIIIYEGFNIKFNGKGKLKKNFNGNRAHHTRHIINNYHGRQHDENDDDGRRAVALKASLPFACVHDSRARIY